MTRARKNLRLKQYDYSTPGAYFVTVCVQDRRSLFGDVRDSVMELNSAGSMIQEWWQKLPSKYPDIEVDTHVVMPNHFHGIVTIVGADPCVRPDMSGNTTQGAHVGAPLHTVVQWFKSMTTNQYIRGVKQGEWPVFHGKLWQRNYYEHVIRNDNELLKIREYIANNPLQWALDRENPAATGRVVSNDYASIFGSDFP